MPAGASRASGTGGEAADYLSAPAVAAYFEAREHEAYYQSLKRGGTRRDFHDRIGPVLERFIQATDSKSDAALVDRVMTESVHVAQSEGEIEGHSPLEAARAQCSKGIELLRLSEPLTFDSLKSAYRSAVRRNHPDAGGSHDAMVAVNEAFQFVHGLLRRREIGSAVAGGGEAVTASDGEARDCNAYRYACGEMLFLMALDDWDVEAAFCWLERITSAPWQRSSYAQRPWARMMLTEPAGKLAIRLSLAGLRKEASRALDIAYDGLREARKGDLMFESYVVPAAEVLDGARRAHVVINHRRQAENALRLGIIDSKRYQKITQRLASSAAEEEECEELLQHFQASEGFLQRLPADSVAQGKALRSRLVPEPGYYTTRIAQLTDEQQAEYLISFGGRSTLTLVRKYTFVRLVSLLESALFHPGQVDDAAVEQEARMLASLHDGTGSSYGEDVADSLAQLRLQPVAERQARAALLKTIEHGSASQSVTGGIGLTIPIGGTTPLGMPLSAEYFDLISRPLDDLRTLQRTGSLPEADEDRREREAWPRDLDALRKPEVQAAQQAAFAAMNAVKSDPERAVRECAAYCAVLLDLGRSMVHVQELQLGFWVNRLTATLVRLKRWREALDWLERYFSLPARYRDRSSPSEEASLQKRLARCREMVRKRTSA